MDTPDQNSEVLSDSKTTGNQRRTSITGIRILSTGLCAPSRVVTNEELESQGYDARWIERRTGIKSRHVAAPETATSDLATHAAKQCLANAGVDAADVDLIIVATMTTDHATPTSANIVQANLGCACPAIDMNVACSGFVYSLVTAAQFLFSGTSRKILVIGAEKMTYMADPHNMKTFPLFGDGAGAVLLGKTDTSDSAAVVAADQGDGLGPCGIMAYKLVSLGELGKSLVVHAGGSREPVSHKAIDERRQFLHMDGQAVFKWAVRLVPAIIDEMASLAGIKKDDIDLILMHQANRRIIDAVTASSGVDPEKVYVNVDRYGNTSAASIPIALHECTMSGRIDPGNIVMMIEFGGGLSWGSCVFRY